MAVTINGDGVVDVGGNASSAAYVRLYEDSDNGTNYVDLIAPASVASNRTLTLPDNTGTVITTASTFAGTGPAFSARIGANQSVTTATLTKLTFDTEIFDTASCYDPTTNYRFTPNVAGYYQVNAIVTANAGSGSLLFLYIYKNGSQYIICDTRPSFAVLSAQVSDVIYMNGSTDYLELYGRIDGTTPQFFGSAIYSRFSGALVRAA